jgi:hypothetical protein
VDDAYLRKRIRVILVTTRAAARSLEPGDVQVAHAYRRGLLLLDAMREDLARESDSETREQLAQARRELESALEDRTT